MSEIAFRLADSADAEGVWAVRTNAIRRGCHGYYPPDFVEQWAAAPMPASFPARIEGENFVVALSDFCVIGFAGLGRAGRKVDAVFVDQDFAGGGIGMALLARVEEQAGELGIEVLGLDASLNAVAFYETTGYRRLGDGRHITSNGLVIACVRMEKVLGGRISG